jgi:hypothetical protein
MSETNPAVELVLKAEAITADKQFRALWDTMRSAWYELGKQFHNIAEKNYWKFLSGKDGKEFASINAWLAEAVPEVGRSTIYAARNAYNALKAIPEAELRKIPVTNAHVLKELPEKERVKAKWVKAAQTDTEQELVSRIETELPDLHIERRKNLKLRPEASQHAVIDEAIEVMGWLNEIQGRENNLEAIAAAFLDFPCAREGFTHLTNREAYAQRKAIGAGA